jgi:hypothetical protein
MNYTCIYPLADALQINIDVYRKDMVDFELKGNRKFVLPLSKKSDLTITAKIEASFVDRNTSAVLVHIAKDFWVYVTFDNTVDLNGTMTLYYLSFAKLNVKAIKMAVDGYDIDTALVALRPAIKAQFTKPVRDIEWVPVALPSKFKKVAATQEISTATLQ